MSSKDFAIGNMADDLLNLTLELCGKDGEKRPRFPKVFYRNYVHIMVTTALAIQECVFEANEIAMGEMRKEYQKKAAVKCTYLNHLVRVAHERGYISEKQRDRWQKLITALKWSVVKWIRSDETRTKS